MAGETGASFANALLKLIFNGTSIPNIADNAASSPLTNLYLSLHSADPTASGNQTSNEVSYTGYARVAVARTSSGFTVSGNALTLTSLVSFGTCTAGSTSASYWAIGTASSGSGEILYAGPLSPTITIGATVTPELTPSSSLTMN